MRLRAACPHLFHQGGLWWGTEHPGTVMVTVRLLMKEEERLFSKMLGECLNCPWPRSIVISVAKKKILVKYTKSPLQHLKSCDLGERAASSQVGTTRRQSQHPEAAMVVTQATLQAGGSFSLRKQCHWKLDEAPGTLSGESWAVPSVGLGASHWNTGGGSSECKIYLLPLCCPFWLCHRQATGGK